MKKIMLAFLISLVLVSAAPAALVSGVNEYFGGWGCAPNAAASVMDYYGLPVDVGALATAMGTTGIGTYVMNIASGIESYTRQHGYDFEATTLDYREFSWLDYTNAIDSNHPVLMAVDSNGDYNCDHEVIAIGYEDRGILGLYYGFYTGWEDTERIQWEHFSWAVFNDSCWGISFGTFVYPILVATQPVPEPTTILLFGLGLIGLSFSNRIIGGNKNVVGSY
jgi:hypothetical protein